LNLVGSGLQALRGSRRQSTQALSNLFGARLGKRRLGKPDLGKPDLGKPSFDDIPQERQP
jgi:hypothetical protein